MTLNLIAPDDRPTEQEAERAIKTLIAFIGDDPSRPGIQETPGRVLKAWREDWGRGYDASPDELVRLFDMEEPESLDAAQLPPMVIVKGISFYSTCEHHMAPFFGHADIAYIPTNIWAEGGVLVPSAPRIIGISKLARITDHFARRLQVQERLTQEIAGFLGANLSPHVAVKMTARHMCMVSRGVKQHECETVTSALKGEFYSDRAARAEFYSLVGA